MSGDETPRVGRERLRTALPSATGRDSVKLSHVSTDLETGEQRLVTDGGRPSGGLEDAVRGHETVEWDPTGRDYSGPNRPDRWRSMLLFADLIATRDVVDEVSLKPGGAVDAIVVSIPYGGDIRGDVLRMLADHGLAIATMGSGRIGIHYEDDKPDRSLGRTEGRYR
jgi:hypothetical protein